MILTLQVKALQLELLSPSVPLVISPTVTEASLVNSLLQVFPGRFLLGNILQYLGLH